MSRHYIGITSKGPTTFRNVGKDDTGEPELLLRQGETARLVLDYADWLDTGETIASATASAESVTASLGVVVSGATSLTLSLSNATAHDYGKITITLTTTSGAIRREIIRVRRPSLYTDEQFYRDYA